MGEGRPAWFYVDGQLRYRDEDGWTDQYQAIDSASEANVLVAEPDDVAPVTRAEARKRSIPRNARGHSRPQETRDVLPEVTQRGGAVHRTKANRPRTHALRRICAVVLIAGAVGVWFGMSPAGSETSSGYHQTIAAALAADANHNKTARCRGTDSGERADGQRPPRHHRPRGCGSTVSGRATGRVAGPPGDRVGDRHGHHCTPRRGTHVSTPWPLEERS